MFVKWILFYLVYSHGIELWSYCVGNEEDAEICVDAFYWNCLPLFLLGQLFVVSV